MSVLVIKLVTSEEIVGKVNYNDNSIEVLKPLLLVLGQKQDGSFTHQIVPFALSVKDHKLNIHKDKVVFMEAANDDLVAAYQQATGDIMTPPKGLVIAK